MVERHRYFSSFHILIAYKAAQNGLENSRDASCFCKTHFDYSASCKHSQESDQSYLIDFIYVLNYKYSRIKYCKKARTLQSQVSNVIAYRRLCQECCYFCKNRQKYARFPKLCQKSVLAQSRKANCNF